MSKILRPATLLLAITVGLSIAGPAVAQQSSPGDGAARSEHPEAAAGPSRPVARANGTARAPQLASPLRRGITQWSFLYTYGINQQINASALDIDITTAGVRWSYLWGEAFQGFLRGHPAVAIEVLPMFAFVGAGDTTWAFGANLLYEHHFAAHDRVLPVWRLGAGMLYADDEIPAGETRFNFSVLMGLGIDILVGENRTLFVGYRFHHVSNANIGDINPGINAHAFVLGLSLFR